MSYLVYNSQMITSGGQYVGKIASTPIPDKIDLISGADSVTFSSLPVVTGSKTINARMYIQDTSTNFQLIWSNGVTQDYVNIAFGTSEFGRSFMVEAKNSPSLSRKVYDLAAEGVLGVPFSLEIVKTTGTIVSVKFNGNPGTDLVGFLGFGPTNQNVVKGIGHSSVWNLEIVGTHKWIGFPYGNTNGAWVDTIGSINGTIGGTPGTINLTT